MSGTPPNDTRAEKELLCAALKGDEDIVRILITEMDERYFVHPHHLAIYNALKDAVMQSGVASPEWRDVRDRVPEDSQARLTLQNYVNTPAGAAKLTKARARGLIKRLYEKYRARCVLDLVEEARGYALSGSSDDAFNVLMDGIFALGRDMHTLAGARYISDYIEPLKQEVDRRRNLEGIVGIRTGIPALDRLFKGLQKKNLYFIGARPGHGKSLVAAQVSYNVASLGKRVLLCSAEMAAEQYLSRLACSLAGVDYERYNGGDYSAEEAERIKAALGMLKERRIVINEAGSQNTSTVRQDIIRYRPDVVIVDYMQQFLPSRPTYNEYKDTTLFSKELNAMKKDFEIPILACVQLSRGVEQREDKRPMASDLRATGQLEQDADVIVMLYRPVNYAKQDEMGIWRIGKEEIDPEAIHFICAKNRHGKPTNYVHYIKDGAMWVVPEKYGEEDRPF